MTNTTASNNLVDFDAAITNLLSDGTPRKTKDIIKILNLKCEKSYLNREYLYPMMKKGILTNNNWCWNLK